MEFSLLKNQRIPFSSRAWLFGSFRARYGQYHSALVYAYCDGGNRETALHSKTVSGPGYDERNSSRYFPSVHVHFRPEVETGTMGPFQMWYQMWWSTVSVSEAAFL